MILSNAILLEACKESNHKRCRKCGAIYHFQHLDKCIEPGCDDLKEQDLSDNYFRTIYSRSFDEAVKVEAEEHSGQVDGNTRKNIENQFKDPDSSLNTIICTPTMELGIDIGALSTVYMRNVPPSPSNYAQRSGRAGRKNQPSIITTFCGVGARRGPHDQYFYKYPDKIISGKITPPRFMLDNKKLIITHIHSLILEEADMRLPSRPREILEMDLNDEGTPFVEGFPMVESFKDELKIKIENVKDKIAKSVKEAFVEEMGLYSWFDEGFVLRIINTFVKDIDNTFDYCRKEYESLLREVNLIDIKCKKGAPNKIDNIRRSAIERKLEAMRAGEKNFSTYNYLRGQGFLPSYGFPVSYASLSLSDADDEISRDKIMALYEFAPGNTIYFKNQKYTITRARPRTEEHRPVMEAVLICPECDSIFLGNNAKSISACPDCGESLENHHYIGAMEFPDMYASRKERITSDEEERVRLGYSISLHYEKCSELKEYTVDSGISSFKITYEHNGNIIVINRGTNKIEKDGQEMGFVFCNACNQWLFGARVDEHLKKEGKKSCSRNATEEDIIRGLYLFTKGQHDVVTLDIPRSEDLSEDQHEAFYLSVKEAILQGIQISLNIEESEIKGYVKAKPKKEDEFSIIIFERAEGGIGIVEALTDKNRLMDILSR
ncbi:MAG: helicase-related protein, partial [Thermodesulfobacteriota bacterium]|nr:helicase-related protein [Thermodesulfobacteriota bacterium]